LHRKPRNEVDLPYPQRRAGRQGIFHNTELERVDVGEPLPKVVGILFQDDVLAGDPLLEDIGSSTNRMVQPVLPVGLERLGGNHRDTLEVATESGEERTGGLLHTNTQCVLVNCLNRFDFLVVWSY